MKTKNYLQKVLFSSAIAWLCTGHTLNAQTNWSINGNTGINSAVNYLGTSDANDVPFRTSGAERGRLLSTGEWRFGTGANYASINNGVLKFNGTGVYQVAGNKYAFQYSGNPNYGLFFNSSAIQYEFRNGSATPVFYVKANTGEGVFLSTLKVGAYTLPATDGLNNQVLKTDGAGNLTWKNDNNNSYSAGSGLSLAGGVFTNTAPDQTVTISGSNGIGISGTYPNFTVNGNLLWRRAGNAGTNSATDFIGTTDAVDLVARTNNTERMRIYSSGYTSFNYPVGVNGSYNSSYSLTANASSSVGGIYITDPVDNTGIYLNKSGLNTGIASYKSSTSSGVSSIYGSSAGTGAGIEGYSSNSSGYGVYGYNSSSGTGVYGSNYSFGNGVYGYNGSSGYGVYGYSSTGYGIVGSTGNSSGYYAGVFFGYVYASNGYITSDERLKKDIHDFNSAMSIIDQLHPRQYSFRNDESKYKGLNLPTGSHYGFLAQDVEKVLPNLVKETKYIPQAKDNRKGLKEGQEAPKTDDEEVDFKALNYVELIPIMVKAMQEQQKQIEDLKKQVAYLSQGNAVATPANTSNDVAVNNVNVSSASLEQNIPNPLKSATTIRYSVPVTAKNAAVVITDLTGKTIKTVTLKAGAGSINVDASSLANGTYTYTLLIDGKTTESKKMVVSH